MKNVFATLISLFIFSFGLSGQDTKKVFTSDLDNFWIAYDSIQTTKDSPKQIDFIKTLYIAKGRRGLKAMR